MIVSQTRKSPFDEDRNPNLLDRQHITPEVTRSKECAVPQLNLDHSILRTEREDRMLPPVLEPSALGAKYEQLTIKT